MVAPQMTIDRPGGEHGDEGGGDATEGCVLARLDLPDEAATLALGARLAGLARPGDRFALWGGLGAGKTVLARGFIHGLGLGGEEVPSPTFTLVQTYDAAVATIYHFDLYRIEDPEETLELDIEDAFADGISLIEWPDRLGGYLPARRLDLRLDHVGGDGRRAVLACPDAAADHWRPRLAEAGFDA